VFIAVGCIALILWVAAAPSAQDLQHVGNFHNVSSRDGGEHCAGYSLGLWKYRERLLGLLDVHQGLCGDPPCAVIRDAKLDMRTGSLEFWSLIDGQKIHFEGALTHEAIDGMFNEQRARLVIDRGQMISSFEPNRSLAAWCDFWRSVPRCSGVDELCRSIKG
jgi:hypothetical protein